VCVYATGAARYGEVAREAALSVLDHSTFDLCLVHDIGLDRWVPRSSRVERLPLRRAPAIDPADPFNGKLEALRLCIERSRDDLFIMLDADAVVTRAIGERDLRAALGGKGMGMVEQKRTVSNGMGREDLYAHYCRVSLQFDAPHLPPPALEAFRYFNSGVMLLEREAALAALDWACGCVRDRPRPHRIGQHMITDQDHFQVWTNSIQPGCCAELPWYWNHCGHWDADFPRADAWIVHFSNFCQGPGPETARRMRLVRRTGGWRAWLRDLRR
jgi:hypothetical protein